MKLRGELRFELELLLQKRLKSLKGSRDNKIQKDGRTYKSTPSLLQVIADSTQPFVIAVGAAIVIDYLKNGSIGNSWIIAGIVVIGLILVRAFKPKSS